MHVPCKFVILYCKVRGRPLKYRGRGVGGGGDGLDVFFPRRIIIDFTPIEKF